MKVQCNVCESAEAAVFCCADEAALCCSCDEKVHAANKLASKHQRVPLSNSNNQMPKCDICQETDGYFFCLEDRALLCRKCDVAIHSVNTLVSSHQRFLLTGVKVGVETALPSSVKSSLPCEKISEARESLCVPNSVPGPVSMPAAGSDNLSSPNKLPFGGGSSANQWQFDEFFGFDDLNQNYNYIENGSSKADSNKMGDSDCSSILRALEVELDSDACFQVPDSSSWAVPDISSPPTTASGLGLPKHYDHDHRSQMESVAFVPDVCYSLMTDFSRSQQNLKRRRYF